MTTKLKFLPVLAVVFTVPLYFYFHKKTEKVVVNPNRWINILYIQICSKQKIKWRFLLKIGFWDFFNVILVELQLSIYPILALPVKRSNAKTI